MTPGTARTVRQSFGGLVSYQAPKGRVRATRAPRCVRTLPPHALRGRQHLRDPADRGPCRSLAPTRSPHAHRPAPVAPRRAASCPAPGRWRWRWPACSRCRACAARRCAARRTPRIRPASPASPPPSSPGRWPPFSSTAGTPRRSSAAAARCIAATVRDRQAGQHLGLGQVRRDHAGHRQQQPDQGSDRVVPQQRRAALGDHHRIDHQRHARRMSCQCRRRPPRSSPRRPACRSSPRRRRCRPARRRSAARRTPAAPCGSRAPPACPARSAR